MKYILTLLVALLLATSSYAQENPDIDLTGSWASPEYDGSGFLIDDSPEGLVVYWFSYDPDIFNPDAPAEQLWFVASPSDTPDLLDIYRPSGTWMGLEYEPGEVIGNLSVVPFDENTAILTFVFTDFGPCAPVMAGPIWPWCDMALEITRVTRVVAEE